jgi:hypothetical protein
VRRGDHREAGEGALRAFRLQRGSHGQSCGTSGWVSSALQRKRLRCPLTPSLVQRHPDAAAMSPPGRPKGESLSAQREGSPVSPYVAEEMAKTLNTPTPASAGNF